ncbi:MAG: lysis protein [Gammaproteobacteria bacterium]|nr:lysis protein [Gammaproteobacteria bacterium]MDP2346823.1 lysis protein [Gammaproteobacteria bacterium]
MYWAIIKSPLARYAALLGAGILIGLTINSWRLERQIAELNATHAQELATIAQVVATKSREALNLQLQAQNEVSNLDRKYTDDMASTQAETDRLRAAVVSGERRLRIQASCPVPANGLPDATSTPSVDDDTSPRLTDASERDYWTLRQRITVAANQIGALQEYITSICLRQTP